MPINQATSLVPEQDYRQTILELGQPLNRTQVVDIDQALGRVLYSDIRSKVDLPPFRNSAMDGYAVRASDTTHAPVSLRVIGDIPAGAAAAIEVTPGTAARIMTGAPVPPGADAIVQVELTDGGGVTQEQVAIFQSVTVGASIREAAEDIAVADVVVSAGSVVDPGTVGVLAATGQAQVPVAQLPRVAVVATGDELYPVGSKLPPGGIYDSNSHQLAALVRRANAELGEVVTLTDDIDQAVDRLTALAQGHDLIVTTGGVSAGAYEVIKDAFARLGGAKFQGVAIQPGKPQGFAKIGETPAVMLPGNPMSALVSFELFVRPLIRKLSGLSEFESPAVLATCMTDLKRRPDRTRYLPATLDLATMQVTTPQVHGSHRVSTAHSANSLIRVLGIHEQDFAVEGNADSGSQEVIPAGSLVRVLFLN